MTLRNWVLSVICAVAIFSVRIAFAQVDQGSIRGSVKDQSGATIAGAAVTLTEIETNFTSKGTTDGEGV
jgi:hypothetical protein